MRGSEIAFFRGQMLGPELPPASQRGVAKWLRENLFSGWLNSILTLLALVVLFYLMKWSLPWLLNGVWNANSLRECRDIIIANAGPDAPGACWALIRARWHQFIFGFYPPALWWRPILSFALLFVALAPVLYADNRRAATILVAVVGFLTTAALIATGLDARHVVLIAILMAHLAVVAWVAPGKLLWLTLLFPAIGFYLLWGGSIWGPIGTLVGFALIFAVWRALQGRFGVVVAAGLGLVEAAIWWLLIQSSVTEVLHNAFPVGLEPMDSDKFGGFLLAFVIGVASISVSLPIGILLALGRRSDMILIKALSVGFIEFVRGVPLITMLFTASLLLQYFLPPQTNFDLILRVVILVTLFSAAYNAEVVRGGLAGLPRGQYEAADALGLDYWQAQRLIIMPQALKISIPGIVSNFIGLFKDTTLVAFVGLADPLRGITAIVRSDINWKGIYWEPYIFVGAIFFLVCFGMSRYSMYLERKLKTDHR